MGKYGQRTVKNVLYLKSKQKINERFACQNGITTKQHKNELYH